MKTTETVAVIGASAKEDRYSNKAMKMLSEYGHTAIPVAPATDTILGQKAYAHLADVPGPIDTVTMYVGPARQQGLFETIIAAHPKRVIFNPGSENPDEYDRLRAAGIEPIEACTLVLLRTAQF
jgi:uncharacterized protein